MKKIASSIIFSRLNSRLKKLLDSYDITIIGVTGSVGKTSAKHAIGEVLRSTQKVRYSTEISNSDIDIMLSFFGKKVPSRGWSAIAWKKILKEIDLELENYLFETVIIELADDKLSKMRRLLKTIRLDYGVVTGIAPVHMDKMFDIRSIVHANWSMVSQAKHIIYNSDVESLRKKSYKNGTTGFGLSNGNVRFKNISRLKSGFIKADLHIGKSKKNIHTKVLGEQNLYSLLSAASVAHDMEIPFSAICFELENIKPLAGRMNLIEGINKSKIIDDSYDASPSTVLSALETLKDFSGRKIAVIGSMEGLGPESSKLHQQIGDYCSDVVDMLVTIGDMAEDFVAPSAIRNGLRAEDVKVFKTPFEAGHYLKGIIRKGDTILLEGDKNISFAEEVARIILSPDLNPETVLVRQDKYWKRKKINILRSN